MGVGQGGVWQSRWRRSRRRAKVLCDSEVDGVHRGRSAGRSNTVKGSAVVVLVSGELGSKVGIGGADGRRTKGGGACFIVKGLDMAGAKEGDAFEDKLVEA